MRPWPEEEEVQPEEIARPAETGPFSHLVSGSALPRLEGRSQPQHQGSTGTVLGYGEHHLAPWTRLKARHYEIARLLFLGKNQNDIAERMGMSACGISLLANDDKIRAEVDRMRDLAFERTVGERLKDIGPESMDIIENVITGELPAKTEKRIELAQWVVEKLDGKAGQKIDVASSTLDRFMQVITEMKASGESLDVTPKLAPVPPENETQESALEDPEVQTSGPQDWAAWLDEKVP